MGSTFGACSSSRAMPEVYADRSLGICSSASRLPAWPGACPPSRSTVRSTPIRQDPHSLAPSPLGEWGTKWVVAISVGVGKAFAVNGIRQVAGLSHDCVLHDGSSVRVDPKRNGLPRATAAGACARASSGWTAGNLMPVAPGLLECRRRHSESTCAITRRHVRVGRGSCASVGIFLLVDGPTKGHCGIAKQVLFCGAGSHMYRVSCVLSTVAVRGPFQAGHGGPPHNGRWPGSRPPPIAARPEHVVMRDGMANASKSRGPRSAGADTPRRPSRTPSAATSPQRRGCGLRRRRTSWCSRASAAS